MKIIVPVKRVVDTSVRVRVKARWPGMDLASGKMSLNTQCQETLRTAMAIRADCNPAA